MECWKALLIKNKNTIDIILTMDKLKRNIKKNLAVINKKKILSLLRYKIYVFN